MCLKPIFVIALIISIWMLLLGPLFKLYDLLRAKLSPTAFHYNGYVHTTDYRSATHQSQGGR